MADPVLPADGDPNWGGVLRAAILDTSDRADGQLPRTTQTATYTLVAADAGRLVEMNVATAQDLTVPAGVFSADQTVYLRQYGAGQTSVKQGAGMTVRCRGKAAPYQLAGQYAEATLTFRSASEAVLSGDIG